MTDADHISLRKFLAPEIIFGEGALSLAGRYAMNFGAGKALLVTDPGVCAAGWTGAVRRSLEDAGIACAVFDGLTPNPKDHEVMTGVKFYREERCDVIIAVGGGSPMDCAKAIGIAASNGQHVLEFEGVDEVAAPGPPLICIPTTAGSSADVSQFAIISDVARRLKIAIISKTMVPDVALVDPATTVTMSPELTAATGMDALVHAIEAFVSNASSPLTDLYALEAVRLVAVHLTDAVAEPRNMTHRNAMMLASLLAGLAFSNASLGLVHGMAHAVGGFVDAAHGDCNAILLGPVIGLNFHAAADKYRAIARQMGLHLEELPAEQQRARLTGAIDDLRRRAGIDATLGQLGVTLADIPQMAINASRDPCLVTNPVQPTVRQIEEIYERVLQRR